MIELETTRQKQPVARASWGWTYLMCPPDRYDVVYSINPWMNTAIPVDRGRAREQWDALGAALEAAGAQVRTVEPRAGVPDRCGFSACGVGDPVAARDAAGRLLSRAGADDHATGADHRARLCLEPVT